MIKNIFLVVLLLAAILLSACHSDNKKPQYSLKFGAYRLKYTTIINITTKETTTKNFDGIINDTLEFSNWGNLLNFGIGINESTEYFYKQDNRCFVLNEGLAFEVIGDNTLKLHFPYWRGSDFQFYDVVIILSWVQTYG